MALHSCSMGRARYVLCRPASVGFTFMQRFILRAHMACCYRFIILLPLGWFNVWPFVDLIKYMLWECVKCGVSLEVPEGHKVTCQHTEQVALINEASICKHRSLNVVAKAECGCGGVFT